MPAIDANAPTPEPPRFSVRGLLITTAVVALFAAIGGAAYRRVDSASGTIMLAFWAACGAAVPAVWWYQLRREYKSLTKHNDNPAVRFSVPIVGAAASPQRSPRARWFWSLGVVGLYLAQYSFVVAQQAEQSHSFSLRANNVLWFVFVFFLGAIIVSKSVVRLLINRSAGRAGLTDEGFNYQRRTIPWSHIHDVKRTDADPAVLFLRRYDGDLYLRPRDEEAAAVEAFIRRRTGLTDDASTPAVATTS